ncbi:MAG: hypothetical protein HYU64_04950 [Armatimonadetes bacterium]|nr:hypothetical protein [Armatimonadota bacterium]
MDKLTLAEIPRLSLEEIQRLYTWMWVGMLTDTFGFTAEKLGAQGLRELNDRMAEHEAERIRQTPIPADGALKYALTSATVTANLMGFVSRIEDGADSEEAVLVHEDCASLRVFAEFQKMNFPMSREQYCGSCSGYNALVARKLGLRMETTYTEKGCTNYIHKGK